MHAVNQMPYMFTIPKSAFMVATLRALAPDRCGTSLDRKVGAVLPTDLKGTS